MVARDRRADLGAIRRERDCCRLVCRSLVGEYCSRLCGSDRQRCIHANRASATLEVTARAGCVLGCYEIAQAFRAILALIASVATAPPAGHWQRALKASPYAEALGGYAAKLYRPVVKLKRHSSALCLRAGR